MNVFFAVLVLLCGVSLSLAACPIGFSPASSCTTCTPGYSGAACTPDKTALSFPQDLDVAWKVSAEVYFGYKIFDTDTVRFALKGRTTGYVAFGPASTPLQMVGQKGIVIGYGTTASPTINSHDLNGQLDSLIAASSGNAIGRTYFSDDGTFSTLFFERKLDAQGNNKVALTTSSQFSIIYALCSQDKITLHDKVHSFFSVNFAAAKCPSNCNLVGTCSSTGTCTCDTGYSGAACDTCASGYTKDSTGACVASVKIDAETRWESMKNTSTSLASDNFIVRYELSADKKTITFGIRGKTTGWVALGIDCKSMVCDYLIHGYVAGGVNSLTTYKVTDRSASAFSKITTGPALVDAAEASGSTTMFFSRAVDQEPKINLSGKTAFIYGYGTSDNLSQHSGSSKGAFSINFVSGGSSVNNSGDKKRSAHGTLMIIGWGFCTVLGMIFGRYFRHLGGPVWFNIHRTFMTLGLVVTICGFGVAISMVSSHFRVVHSVFGIVVMVLGVMQPINAIFRPAPYAENRWIFNLVHRGNGYLTLALSIVTIFLGLHQNEAKGGYFAFMGIWYGLVAIFMLVGEFTLIKKRPAVAKPQTQPAK